jgi:hypothetical protein
MPVIYLKKNLYDKIINRGQDVGEYVNKTVKKELDQSN